MEEEEGEDGEGDDDDVEDDVSDVEDGDKRAGDGGVEESKGEGKGRTEVDFFFFN